MDSIKKLLDTYHGKTYDLCFEIIEKFGDNPSVFEFVCENFNSRSQEKTYEIPAHFSESDIEYFESIYGDTVNVLLTQTIKQCNAGLIKPEDFYTSLWESYKNNFISIEEKAFALYYTIIDVMIPYHYLGKALSMSNSRFQELLAENKESIEKLKYIKESKFKQYTERASLILNCLDAIQDFESKAVILSCAIMTFAPKDRAVNKSELEETEKTILERITKLEEIASIDIKN